MYENAAYLLVGIALGIVLMAYVWYLDQERCEAEVNCADQLYADSLIRAERYVDGWREAVSTAITETQRADMFETAFRGEMQRQVNLEAGGWVE
jgi:hypothetical protein